MNVRLMCALLVIGFGINSLEASVGSKGRARRQRVAMDRRAAAPEGEAMPVESKQRPAVSPEVAKEQMGELASLEAKNKEIIEEIAAVSRKKEFVDPNPNVSAPLIARAEELRNQQDQLIRQIADVAARGA